MECSRSGMSEANDGTSESPVQTYIPAAISRSRIGSKFTRGASGRFGRCRVPIPETPQMSTLLHKLDALSTRNTLLKTLGSRNPAANAFLCPPPHLQVVQGKSLRGARIRLTCRMPAGTRTMDEAEEPAVARGQACTQRLRYFTVTYIITPPG